MTSAEAILREGEGDGKTPAPDWRFSLRRAGLWGAGLLLALAGGGILWSERGLGEARLRAKHGLWSEVHAPVERYLRIHPGSAEANLLCAEAFVKDDALPLNERIGGAVARLRAIPDEAPQAVEARLAEARVQLFLNYSPAVAELAMRRALKLDPEEAGSSTTTPRK
jgi:hypothetical protein